MFHFSDASKPVAVAAAILACVAVTREAKAAGLELDPTWGGSGIVETKFGEGTRSNATAAVLPQPDGKVIAVGTHSENVGGTLFDSFAAARFLADGTLDTTFGTGGRVIVPRIAGSAREELHAATFFPGGKILLAGDTACGNGLCSLVVRLNPTGSIDTTFGTNGRVLGENGLRTSKVEKILVQPNGNVLVRRTDDHALWDLDGVFIKQFALAPNGGTTLQADGKIIDAAGYDGFFRLYRWHQNADYDGAYEGVFQQSGKSYIPTHLEARPDGKLAVIGFGTQNFGPTISVAFAATFLADGTFDSDAAYASSSRPDFGLEPAALAIQPDNSLVIGGTVGRADVICLGANLVQQQEWTDTRTQRPGVTSLGLAAGRIYAGTYAADGIGVVALRTTTLATGSGSRQVVTREAQFEGAAATGNASAGGCSVAQTSNSFAGFSAAALAFVGTLLRRRRTRASAESRV